MAVRTYILLALSVTVALVLTICAYRNIGSKQGLRRSIKIPAILVLVFMVLTVVLFPGLPSVSTTGEYAFASTTIELADTSRTETYAAAGANRKLEVLVYYPDSGEIAAESAPLIVFSHGGISLNSSNKSLFQELASHGYVVASIGHTYHALTTNIGGKTIFADSGYTKELNTEDSHTDIENSSALYQKWMNTRMADMNFVIDTLTGHFGVGAEPFYSLIAADNIGVAGHSLGGSAALGVARQREDVKAVIALEAPFMHDITGVAGTEFTWNTQPYVSAIMNIYSDSAYPALVAEDNKYVQNKNYLTNNAQVEYYHISGANHYSLTDLSRTSPIICALLGGSYRDGYDTLAFINARSVSFFDKHLA